MRVHRIYCKSVSDQDSIFDLDQSQSNHISKVLRLRIEDKVEVFDGNGATAVCKIIEINRTIVILERITEIAVSDPAHPKIVSLLPVIKKDNLHFMVQKLTEIGVSDFIFYKPDLIDQSIAKKDLKKILSKINEVVINACKQCGSNFIPSVSALESLESAINSLNTNDHEIYAFDLNASDVFSLDKINIQKNICIITGPESGFSEQEINSLIKKDIKIRLLKNNILRAETAPIVISSLLQNHFGKF